MEPLSLCFPNWKPWEYPSSSSHPACLLHPSIPMTWLNCYSFALSHHHLTKSYYSSFLTDPANPYTHTPQSVSFLQSKLCSYFWGDSLKVKAITRAWENPRWSRTLLSSDFICYSLPYSYSTHSGFLLFNVSDTDAAESLYLTAAWNAFLHRIPNDSVCHFFQAFWWSTSSAELVTVPNSIPSLLTLTI